MRLIICLFALWVVTGCGGGPDKPDVSGIKMEMKSYRFEQELFAIDTLNFGVQFDTLIARYPQFGNDFVEIILGTPQEWSKDSARSYALGFAKAYHKINDSAQKIFKDFTKYEKEILTAARYFKYYFPEKKMPQKIITYIGPLDGYSDIATEDAFLIGLQHHLGKDFSLYSSEWLIQTYPKYVSDRFVPENISVNCMFNLLSDLYPERPSEKPLVVQMVEKGKRLYALEQLLPDKEKHLLIGYSETQLKDCYAHEREIWDLFIKNNYLQSTDANVIRNYVGESPKTQELGESAPGNIGSFAGWQIVKAFMSKNKEKSLKDLMEESPEKIFEQARYKP